MPITKDQLDAWEAQHGRIAHVLGPMKPQKSPDDPPEREWEIAFRKPTRVEFAMFKKNVANPATKFQAQEVIARQMCISHEVPAFEKLLDEYPGIPEACDEAIQQLAGLKKDEIAK